MGERGIHDYPGDIVNEARIVEITRKEERTTEDDEELARRIAYRDEAIHRTKVFPTLAKTHNIFEIDNIDQMSLFWILMLYMAKSGQGEAVKDILLEFFGGAFDALGHYMAQAGDNRITAWGAGRMLSLVFERFGLISQIQAADFASGNSIATGFEVATQFKDLFNFSLTKTEDDGFPDQKTTVMEFGARHLRRATRDDRKTKKSITLEKKESR